MHTAFRRELDRIGEQIGHDLPEAVRIAEKHSGDRGIQRKRCSKILGRRLSRRHFRSAVHDPMKIEANLLAAKSRHFAASLNNLGK